MWENRVLKVRKSKKTVGISYKMANNKYVDDKK
jgi:hypothetical protein